MKNTIYKWILMVTMFSGVGLASAQRSYIGLGFEYNKFAQTPSEYYENGNYISGNIHGNLTSIGIYYTHYSGVRRGYTLGVTPVTKYKSCFTSSDGQTYNEVKASGPAFKWGLFGLIASDYLSKVEIHLLNDFTLGLLKNETFVMMDLGLAARYRINRNFKVAVDFYPVSYYVGSTESSGLSGSFKLFYTP